MPQAKLKELQLEWRRFGPEAAEPLLLIHGVGAQLIQWPEAFCDALAAQGYGVLCYDSRDVGLSTHFDDAPIPDPVAVMEMRQDGREPVLPYSISDLAGDAAGLLDALGIASAHVLGVSLGGQVAQSLAIEHPQRVRSLAVMMSCSGNPDVLPANPAALSGVTRIADYDEAVIADNAVLTARAIGSPGYPTDDRVIRERAVASARRAYHPAGAARHLAVSRGTPDRRPGLAGLRVPTLVVHGKSDRLIPYACGVDVADSIPGSILVGIDGLGHDLPAPLFDFLASLVGANARRGVIA